MLTRIRSNLGLRLSLSLGFVLICVAVGSYSLLGEGIVSAQVASLLCLAGSVVVLVAGLRVGLTPLRQLAKAASMISEGQPLTVKSAGLDEVGQITRALRGMQTSTQAAMSRIVQPDGSMTRVDSTGSWPVIVIGPPTRTRARQAMTVGLAASVLVGALLLVLATTSAPASTPVALPMTRSVTEPAPVAKTPLLPRGVTRDSITLGMSAPFSGAVRSLSDGMKLGIDTAFAEVNAAGGVHGRQLKLIALDNGYEEKRAIETTRDLIENRHVFGLIGNVGTPTAKAILPYVLSNKVLLFGPLTGSPALRNDPPDRYVFNVRASYDRETSQMMSYLLDVKHVPARSIVVFAQNDSFGDAGYDGAIKTLRRKGHTGELLRVGYERNTADVADAANRVLAYATSNVKYGGVRAVIIVATATASASFTAKIASLGAIVMNVSFVDAGALALEFKDHWPGVGNGVIVTQVVPHFDAGATGVIRYREALKTFFPDKSPGFASLEGFVVGELFAEGLRRAGPGVDTEKMVDALEKIQDFDLGTGGALSFGVSKHQASQKVWGTQLTADGSFKPLDAEWTE